MTVPGSVNIGAGLSSATFTATVAAVTSDQTALLTATLNGLSQTFTLSRVRPGSAKLAGLRAFDFGQQRIEHLHRNLKQGCR